jgi:RHS repeat-associated protein
MRSNEKQLQIQTAPPCKGLASILFRLPNASFQSAFLRQLRRLCVMLTLLAAGLRAQSPPWYNASWTYRTPITINNSRVAGSSNLTNFPVLISLSSDSNLVSYAQTTGNDILFTDSSGTNKLNHEIEKYVSSTGQLIAWVQVPTVSVSANTVIYMYYGNASAGNQQNPTGAWDSNYKAVFHFANGTGLNTNDSTSNADNAMAGSGVSAVTGEIGGGAGLNGTTTGALSFSQALNSSTFTVEAWVYTTALDPAEEGQPFFYQGTGSSDVGTTCGAYGSNGSNAVGAFFYAGGAGVGSAQNVWPINQWVHVVCVSNNLALTIYVSGVSVATGTGGAAPSNNPSYMGKWYNFSSAARYLDGNIDEVRVSNIARSAGWIATEYNNQSSPSTFYSVGSQQNDSGNTVTITVTTAPAGLLLTVNGTGCTAPCDYQWTPGSNQTIGVSSPQSGPPGTQYLYANWSDGGAQSHSITVPSSPTTYTANFSTQYYLTTVASSGGSISPSSEWVNSGAGVSVSASANSGYQFTGFSGALAGTTTPQILTMTAPFTVTANFSTGSGGLSTFVTTYTYDLLNNLTGVTMIRPTGTQVRTFNYNNTPYLQSATNPENGTVTYTYNSYNKVASKTDAKGQVVVYTYDTYARLTEVQRYPQGTSNAEAVCQRETYYYDTNPFNSSYSQYDAGRLTAVQYYGGSTIYGQTNGNPCDTTFTEMYNYSQPGGKIGKELVVTRASATGTLSSTYTYDNEGRMTAARYPGYGPSGSPTAGPNPTWTRDTMGRLNTMTDATTGTNIVTATSYGPSNEMLSMTGQMTNTYTYNAMLQLTSVYANSSGGLVNVTYNYSSTQNNGKATSQTDNVSGEQVVYTYDALNRLASAAATSGSWGQSYSYDGFGNLTNQTVTAGSAPSYSVVPDPTTNHVGSVDANGNTLGTIDPYQDTQINSADYDVANRFVGTGASFSYTSGYQYSYAPGNKRVWRGNFGTNSSGGPMLTTDEVTFWGVNGKKLASYNIVMTLTSQGAPQSISFNLNVASYYFGKKLVGHYNGAYSGASTDRLGSVGKYYPYGQEKPSATANGTEKFTGYFRDSETGFDYAVNRYHNPGTGRFLTPDPYRKSARRNNPGSWNRYSYTHGDPVNRVDRRGLVEGADGCDPEDPDCDGDDGGDGGGDSGDGGDNGDNGSDPEPQYLPMTPTVQQNLLNSALDIALQMLENPQCVISLFNNVPGSVSPSQVLQQLVSNGNVVFGDIDNNSTAATTQILIGPPGGSNSALITLNNNGLGQFSLGTNSYGLSSNYYDAMVLIHELGHAYADIYGPASTQITSDADDVDASVANTQQVISACFQQP